eukprot:NODE_2258_length_966_cov_816.492865.p2 GENE.NODE_2258_length_966_cov_816.492865~~NODE_2258_length_966_cov_816.492865.p2  ORF type:complete len:206 (-),score=68.65 NODE_2258_length_966_cov_816.492865:332-862(-)
MTMDWWRSVLQQSFSALAYMHERAVMHCDIKEPNLMVRNEDFRMPQICVIDLGMASAMTEENRGVCGTPGYIPPETWIEGKWFPKGDIFSLGVVIVQLMTNQVPNEKRGIAGVFQSGCQSMDELKSAVCVRAPPINSMMILEPNFVGLVDHCLAKDRRARLKAPQALQNPWLMGTA